MSPRQLKPTLADYMAIAISPVLIMGLIGSLCFFLLAIFYRGEYLGRVHWIMFWFVMAIVLITRIAIEEGAERAGLFGVVLSAAILLAVMRFAPDFVLGAVLLLSLLWWCAHRLTWNCTWIDEDEDPGGEGLLAAAGLDQEGHEEAKATNQGRSAAEKRLAGKLGGAEAEIAEPGSDASIETTPGQGKLDDERPSRVPQADKPWWQRMGQPREKRGSRAPGITVVWFSLAALPIFGLGQLLIPAADLATRRYTFWLATIYVACGLGLLMNTAFLGLRRYLRQRGLEMPAAISGAWLSLGTCLIMALVAVSALMPRPRAEYSVRRLAGGFGVVDREASNYAIQRDTPAKGEGQPGKAAASESQPASNTDQNTGGQQQGTSASRASQPPQDGANSGKGRVTTGGNRSGQAQPAKDRGNAVGEASSDRGGSGGKDRGRQPPSQAQESGRRPDQEATDAGANSGQQAKDRPMGDAPQASEQATGRQPPSSRDTGSQPSRVRSPASQTDGSGDPQQTSAEDRDAGAGTPRASDTPGAARPGSGLTDVAGNLAEVFGSVVSWLKWVILALAALFFLWQFWPEIIRLLTALADLLAGLFGGARGETEDEDELELADEETLRQRSFAEFADPFANGAAERLSPEQLVVYSFAALEAWAREHDAARSPDQTPLEFADDLQARFERIGKEVAQAAEFYTYVAYGPGRLSPAVRGPLERLWRGLRSEASWQAAAAQGGTGVGPQRITDSRAP